MTVKSERDPDFELDDNLLEEEEEDEEELKELEDEKDTDDEDDLVDEEELEEDDVVVVDVKKKKTKKTGGWPRKGHGQRRGASSHVEMKQQAQSPGSQGSSHVLVVPDVEDCVFGKEEIVEVRQALLDWYDKNHRVLPWRRNPHSKLPASKLAEYAGQGIVPAPLDLPENQFIYYVWVCEIMSQQTQVSRVCEYFKKWIATWPTVEALAQATQEQVNDMWAGLGYYRRARYLLEGAKYVVNDLKGTFPTCAKDLQKIPGIGAYTSCAIASTACGEQVAVVDGNVVRVLARLRKIAGDPKNAAMVKLFADIADRTLDPNRPGDFNQSLMELGATVCTPNGRPSCETCPVSRWCRALDAEKSDPNKQASVTDYPSKTEKAAKREERVGVTVVRVVPPGQAASAGKFVLVKRPPGGLLAGLWEFPLKHVEAGASQKEIQDALDSYLSDTLKLMYTNQNSHDDHSHGGSQHNALRMQHRRHLGEVVHVFSHIRMTMVVEELCLEGDIPIHGDVMAATASTTASTDSRVEVQWLTQEELQAKGLSSGVKKVFKLYMDQKKRKANSITNFFKPQQKKKQ